MFVDRIEQGLKSFLQKDVTCLFKYEEKNDKQFKKGKLILFSIKDFFITLVFDVDGATKKTEIPMPYDITKCRDGLILDYKLDNLHLDDPFLKVKIISLESQKKSKFYDCKLCICI